ncbi:conserved hypothetical protein [Bradyrhizobium oligotrophicum S58]|uniref:DUF3861 domain-containing protein n=1 Tax=Bradyrhizobium oligotrophicum S58 TaxID=1245469 RepID=M4ZXR5_9BRAD|nr:DUF3861 domain-containing protein [Bradyrhizobium oligotrophicum]BAM91200.1 conserved hypothetical protein [Bradyrhizobium oligotrophicum S58]
MPHAYAIEVTDISPRTDDRVGPSYDFTFTNHDDLNEIVARFQRRDLFDHNESKAFVTGLKLLGGVMLNHRAEPLFAEFAPAFKQFMKTLKSGAKPQEAQA